jgi:hypothetical protein
LIHRTLAPLGSGYAAADDLTNLPVKLNQGGIHRLHRPLAGGANQSNDLSKPGFFGSPLSGVNYSGHAFRFPFLQIDLSASRMEAGMSHVLLVERQFENRAGEQLGSISLLTTVAMIRSDAFWVSDVR